MTAKSLALLTASWAVWALWVLDVWILLGFAINIVINVTNWVR